MFTIFSEFHNQVQTSSNEAENALKTFPIIDQLIDKAREMHTNVEADLEMAGQNAKMAMDTAKDAHHKYAQQASEVCNSNLLNNLLNIFCFEK